MSPLPYYARGVACAGDPCQDGQCAYVELIHRFLRMSSLRCNDETDRARVSLAIARFPSKVASLRMAVDGAVGAPVCCNCVCI